MQPYLEQEQQQEPEQQLQLLQVQELEVRPIAERQQAERRESEMRSISNEHRDAMRSEASNQEILVDDEGRRYYLKQYTYHQKVKTASGTILKERTCTKRILIEEDKKRRGPPVPELSTDQIDQIRYLHSLGVPPKRIYMTTGVLPHRQKPITRNMQTENSV